MSPAGLQRTDSVCHLTLSPDKREESKEDIDALLGVVGRRCVPMNRISESQRCAFPTVMQFLLVGIVGSVVVSRTQPFYLVSAKCVWVEYSIERGFLFSVRI